jgi:type IV pilus assembly protein PilM
MAFGNRLLHLLQDPPPDYVFEVSEDGIAWARRSSGQVGFEELEWGTVLVSPLADNVVRADLLADTIRGITGGATGRKRRPAVLILPDYCARVAVLEFDSFPADAAEQHALVRFRMKKSVPFDIDSAALSFHAQPPKPGTRNVEVVVVVAALEIVARYEVPFRAAGLHPGVVMTSVIPMIELNTAAGVSILARLNGRTLTVAVTNGPALKLVRCVELHEITPEEIQGVLFPTVAYIEDKMSARPSRLLLCGFGHDQPEWVRELDIPVEPLRSRYGLPTQHNAGLMGYLQSINAGVKAA